MASFDGHELPAFKLERFFAEYEFVAPHLLCCSDCEPLAMSEVLQLADPETMQMWNDLRLGYTETAGLPVRHGNGYSAWYHYRTGTDSWAWRSPHSQPSSHRPCGRRSKKHTWAFRQMTSPSSHQRR